MSPKPVTIEAQVLAELRKSFRSVEPSSVLKGLGTQAEVWYLGFCTVEDKFQVRISERERRELVTVADLVKLVQSKRIA